ncbi:MAG TPA: AIR synthase-related protein, partial [Alphaproteobacteria bacterium]|nr:AIR synthase-related protein [Alphaproteobacteria bacterium]
SVGIALKRAGDTIILIGESEGWLGASLYVRELCKSDEISKQVWAPPPVDLGWEKRNGGLVRAVIEGELVSACHDISDGGLLVALAEMALAGRLGLDIKTPDEAPAAHAFLFGEDQGRYVLSAPDPQPILASAHAVGVTATVLGKVTAGGSLTLDGRVLISVEELRSAHEGWLPAYMSAQ